MKSVFGELKVTDRRGRNDAVAVFALSEAATFARGTKIHSAAVLGSGHSRRGNRELLTEQTGWP
jgi:hypothetical protein